MGTLTFSDQLSGAGSFLRSVMMCGITMLWRLSSLMSNCMWMDNFSKLRGRIQKSLMTGHCILPRASIPLLLLELAGKVRTH